MRRDWDPEDLIAYWTLLDSDWKLVANKTVVTRLGFVALLKFFEIEGRFPQYAAEVPESAVGYLAEQVKVDPRLFADYKWAGQSNREVRLTLLAALCHRRTTEITDGLVDLLVQLVDKIDAKAERKVEKELIRELRRVSGKEGILFRIAEAAWTGPTTRSAR